jgi:hypothetical protein
MSNSRPPLPYPSTLQVNDPAAFCRNHRYVNHLSLAETPQPLALEGAGASSGATMLPTPGEENDDTLQEVHLPRDDLSHLRQMIKAIDTFALVKLVEIAGNCMLKSSVFDVRERAGYEPKNCSEAGRVHQAYRRANAGASWLRANHH